MNNTNVWKPIAGFEGYYEASIKGGNIRGVDRTINAAYGSKRTVKGKELSKYINQHGRYTVKIYKEHKGKVYPVSVLVARAFPEICGKWFDGCEVHHKDENPLNNDAENLIVLSHKEHIELHKKSPKTIEHLRNNGYKTTTFSEKPIVQKKNGVPMFIWKNSVEAAETIGYCKDTIRNCLKLKRTTRKGGYTFEYL